MVEVGVDVRNQSAGITSLLALGQSKGAHPHTKVFIVCVRLCKTCSGTFHFLFISDLNLEGWVPSAYLEPVGRKSLRTSQSVSSQDGGKSNVALP
jgi:hypothetical protein